MSKKDFNAQRMTLSNTFTLRSLTTWASEHPFYAFASLFSLISLSGIVVWQKDNIRVQYGNIKASLWNNKPASDTEVKKVIAENNSEINVSNNAGRLRVEEVASTGGSNVTVSSGSSAIGGLRRS